MNYEEYKRFCLLNELSVCQFNSLVSYKNYISGVSYV